MRRTRQQIVADFMACKPMNTALRGARLEAHIARGAALVGGEKHYQATRPCRRGHVGLRLASTGECVECRPFNARSGAGQRDQRLAREYGVTGAAYRRMMDDQGGRCGICNRAAAHETALHVDHDHKTKRVRGLLCGRCNQAIGLLREDPDILTGAIAYLRRAGK